PYPPPPRGSLIVRLELYAPNYEKQDDQTHPDLLRLAGASRSLRRTDLLRDQRRARDLGRELLARPPHDRLPGAGAARLRRLPLGAAGGGGAPPPPLRAHRRGPQGAPGLGRRADRGAAA